jgi:hypothetical protein
MPAYGDQIHLDARLRRIFTRGFEQAGYYRYDIRTEYLPGEVKAELFIFPHENPEQIKRFKDKDIKDKTNENNSRLNKLVKTNDKRQTRKHLIKIKRIIRSLKPLSVSPKINKKFNYLERQRSNTNLIQRTKKYLFVHYDESGNKHSAQLEIGLKGFRISPVLTNKAKKGILENRLPFHE